MEHKKKIWLKGILAVALFVMVFITYLSPVFAAINNSYNSDTGVTQANLKKSIENDNPLVAPIASFVYFIGSVVEWLLGSMTGMVTGMNTMPWADMILYNAVPMLDVNFLNPDPNSMINHLNDVIRKIYFTIFSLALSFFGIAVIVMAIKLAISSIAEEKAKYKSAITNWLMAVVLLFTMHYFMAFIFYLNESIVEMASNITTTVLAKKNFSVNGGVAYSNFKASLKSKYSDASATALKEVEEHLNNNENFYVDFLNNLDENLQKYITKDRDISDNWSAWEDVDETILLFGQLCCETSKNDDNMKKYIYGDDEFDLTEIDDFIKGTYIEEEGKDFFEALHEAAEARINILDKAGLKRLYEIYMKDTTNAYAKELLLTKWQQDAGEKGQGFGLNVIPNNSTGNKLEDILAIRNYSYSWISKYRSSSTYILVYD